MGVQKALAQAVSAVSTAALTRLFHRPGENFPGKVALYIDPRIIADEAGKLSCGSVCVVGTNGKTTVTNLVADALEAQGRSVVCNRTGANLDSGVATTLLHAAPSDWGVFECDELWLSKILPYTRSKYVVLLNLFRDQLDRVGEIDTTQRAIVGALERSPESVLVYNGDDPLCEAIARKAPNPHIAFGIDEDLGLEQHTVSDAPMCQECEGILDYEYRQYGQLGAYRCPKCGFARPDLAFRAHGCHVGTDGMSFDVDVEPQARAFASEPADGADAKTSAGAKTAEADGKGAQTGAEGASADAAAPDGAAKAAGPVHTGHVAADYTGAYMLYNLLAVYAAAHLAGASDASVQKAVDQFHPHNGRLQRLRVDGHDVLLNLAKNPTGFNQNLQLVLQSPGPKAVVFFVNDKQADGHDISWLWDVDFDELAGHDVTAFAGGLRANDVQLRLKYGEVPARLVDDARDAMRKVAADPALDGRPVFMVANYTALPQAREQLTQMAAEGVPAADAGAQKQKAKGAAPAAVHVTATDAALGFELDRPLTIYHLMPRLMNLYGDNGNVKVLERRCQWRGIPVRVHDVVSGETADLAGCDVLFLGGGPDRQQKLANESLRLMRDQILDYVQDDGAMLCVCGGFQIMGPSWFANGKPVKGLSILPMRTERAPEGAARIIDNIVVDSPVSSRPVVGYENHAGRTYLEPGLPPFGKVHGHIGHGNNDDSGLEGALYKNTVCTYLHGPILGKNPQVADWIIQKAVERRVGHAVELPPLDDAVENAANKAMCRRLGVK